VSETMDNILTRRSVRKFKTDKIATEDIISILEAGRWAPSGLNNQPWKFIIIQNSNTIEELSSCTHYREVVKNAPLLISVYLDHDIMYNHTKDVQAVGASIQNMLLRTHDIGLGAVWLGEILNQKDKVNLILNCPESMELMAVLAIGYPANNDATSSRKEIQELCYEEHFGKVWRH
jgi:nitroreductase